MKKDIPSNKGKLEDAMNSVQHSSTTEKNCIFTAYMCRDKSNKLVSLQLTAPRNEIPSTDNVGPLLLFLFQVYLIMIKDVCFPLCWKMNSG